MKMLHVAAREGQQAASETLVTGGCDVRSKATMSLNFTGPSHAAQIASAQGHHDIASHH